MTINSIETVNGRPIQDRKVNIDTLLNKLRNEMVSFFLHFRIFFHSAFFQFLSVI